MEYKYIFYLVRSKCLMIFCGCLLMLVNIKLLLVIDILWIDLIGVEI